MKPTTIVITIIIIVLLAGVALIILQPGGEREAVTESPVTTAIEEPRETPEPSTKTPLVLEAPTEQFTTPTVSVAPGAITAESKQVSPDSTAMHSVEIHVVWANMNEDVPNTTVTLGQQLGDPETWRMVDVTDAAGHVMLQCPKEWTWARARTEHPEAATRGKRFDLPVSEPVIIELQLGSTFFGTVIIAENNAPAAGATVEIHGPGGGLKGETLTDETGTYEIANLGGKNLRISASLDDLISETAEEGSEVVDTEPGKRQGPFDLYLSPGAVIIGTVRERESSMPIEDASISTQYRNKTYEATTEPNGTYTLAGFPAARFELSAKAKGYAHEYKNVNVSPEKKMRCDFELEPGGTVYVIVRDQEKNPLEGARVILMKGFQEVSTRQFPETDVLGEVTLEGVSIANPPMAMAFKEGYEIMGQMPQKPEFHAGETEAEVMITLTKQKGTEGVFTGRVTSETGEPIADATVLWFAMAENPPKTTTDQDGRYRLEVKSGGMIAQMTMLSAFADGWAPLTKQNVAPGPEDNPTEVNFELAPGHWLELTVVDPEEAPIENVFVTVLSSGWIPLPLPSHQVREKTDEEGFVRIENLPGPQVRLNLIHSNYTPIQMKTVSVDEQVRITMSGKGVIKGRVLDSDTNEPIENVTVSVKGSGFMMGIPQQKEPEAFSDSEGRFTLADLDQDKVYDVTVEARDYSRETEKGLRPASEENAKDTLFYLIRAGKFEGVVVDDRTKTPIPDAKVVSGMYQEMPYFDWNDLSENNMALSGVKEVRSDSDGVFVFDERDAAASLLIVAGGYAHRIVSPNEISGCAVDHEGRVIIELEQGASVSGTYYENGAPAPAKQLMLTSAPPQGEKSLLKIYMTDPNKVEMIGMTQTKEEGEYSWDSLHPGAYHISAHSMKGGMGIFKWGRRFELQPGEEKQMDIGDDLGPHTLSGRLLTGDGKPLSNGVINLVPAFDWKYTDLGTVSEPDGAYAIKGLERGEYTAMLMQFSFTDGQLSSLTETFFLDGDMTYDFIFEPGNKVTAQLVFPEDASESVRSLYFQGKLSPVHPDEHEPADISKYGYCIISDGRMVFKGKFKGDYIISLAGMMGDEWVKIDRIFQIDNLGNDQVLGEIPAPLVGKMKLLIAFPEGAWPEEPIALTMHLVPREEGDATVKPVDLALESDPPEQELGPFPAGDYTITLTASGYVPKPVQFPVTIEPFKTPTAGFNLQSETSKE